MKDFISASGGSASNYYSLSTSTHHRNYHNQGVAMSKLINNPTAIDLNLMDDISYADDWFGFVKRIYLYIITSRNSINLNKFEKSLKECQIFHLKDISSP